MLLDCVRIIFSKYIMSFITKISFTNIIPKSSPEIIIKRFLKSIISPSLYSFLFKSSQQPSRVLSLFNNRLFQLTIATIGARVAMKKKTRASMKTPTSASTVTKRRLIDEDDTELDAELVDVESSDEQSGVRKVEKSGKKARMSVEEKTEGQGLEDRKIILGKPLSGKAFFNCGVVKLFSNLGFESFLVDMPKLCYPSLVREFYSQLSENASGQYVSFVADTKITLSPLFLNAILKTPPSPVSIYTKRGFKQLDNFSVKDQFHVLFGADGPTETFPSTTQILPLAHALFRVSIDNVCPRLGTRSNLSAQDVIVVSMLLSGKSFDIGELILKNMIGAIEGKSNTGLPYGLLLTRIFEWFGVGLDGIESVQAKEFLDVKCLTQSNLKLDKDGTLSVVEVPPPPPVQSVSASSIDLGIPAKDILDFMNELRENHKQLVDGQKQLSEQMDDIANQFQFWKDFVFAGKTGNSPEKCSSGSFVYELRRRMVGSAGSSDVKFAFTSEDDATGSPRPRTAMDALKEAAGTESVYAAAGNLMMEQNRVAAELTKKFAQETPDKDAEET